ncbi:MAG: YicC/YloC family endoribonuclease [Betaproteobacteria bacterium]
MTGYASTLARTAATTPESSEETAALSVEIRSVNGRFLDLGFKLPEELRGTEPALRELLAGALKRGKVELRILTRSTAEPAWLSPQPDQLTALARLQAQVQAQMPQARALSVQEALQWCTRGQATTVTDEAALQAARQCLQALLESRQREGEKLVAILADRIQRLRVLAAQAEPLVPAVVQRQQARFLQRWQEAVASAEGAAPGVPAQALQERALQEAATYAIRIDVAEELSRLGAHLEEIDRLLAQGGELGKRLDFLIQELHREANTLGSKSVALELTGISVEMKVLIEQMREQVQNIE